MKPILFNTEMVKAILDGRKTVTRRVIKTENGEPLKYGLGFVIAGDKKYVGKYAYGNRAAGEPIRHVKPPYEVNDILYVRETWHKYTKRVGEGETCHLAEFYGYKASIANSEDANEPWKPSIHMPKEAARIFLKVTGVRVERLQDMGRKEALKEGCPSRIVENNIFKVTAKTETGGENEQNGIEMCVVDFARLWDTTIKKDQLQYYGWNANPYVWVIEFEVIDKAAAMANDTEEESDAQEE